LLLLKKFNGEKERNKEERPDRMRSRWMSSSSDLNRTGKSLRD
jgi:hypothetical protein